MVSLTAVRFTGRYAAPMQRRSSWWQLALLGLVPLMLLGPVLFSGRHFLPQLPASLEPLASENPERAERARERQSYTQSDRLFPFLTDQVAARRELAAGHLPTWEPELGLGVPLFADSIAGLAYPPNVLGLLLPPERAAGPLAALTILLAGLGAFLFLSRIGLGPGAALFGALAYQYGGWGVANLYYFMKVDAALWFPWALWSIEGIARGRRYAGLALACSLAGSILAGMITIGAFVLAGSAVYALVRLTRNHAETKSSGAPALLRAGGFALAGLGMSAIWILPTLEASQQSMRQEATPESLQSQSLPLSTSLGFVLPDLFGSPLEATPSGRLPIAYWLTPRDEYAAAENANQLEWNTYAGLVVCVLALVGVLTNFRRARMPLLLLVGVIGFAQGWPVLRLGYHLPGLNAGHPARILGLAWFLWPWLAALGVHAIAERRPRSLAILLTSAALVLVAGSLLWRGSDGATFVTELESTLIERYDELNTPEDVRARLPYEESLAAGERLARRYASLTLTAAALLGAGLLIRQWRRPSVLLPSLPLILLVLLEGGEAAADHVTGRPADGPLFPDSETIEAIRRAAGDGRVLRHEPSPFALQDVVALARPNLLQPYGIADATGWIVFVPRTYNELFACFDPDARERQGVARVSSRALIGHPILDRLDVRAILSREKLEEPSLEAVLERPGFHVYRRTTALGPARLVGSAVIAHSEEAGLDALAKRMVDPERFVMIAPEFAEEARRFESSALDPGRVASLERPSKDRLHIRVVDSEGAWLVIHQQFYPGWRAEVNGAPTPILRADHALQAVRLPAGDSEVVLDYAPLSLRLGALISVVSALLAAFFSRPRTG